MIGRALRATDEFLAPATVRIFGERRRLLTFLFHVILPDDDVGSSVAMDAGLVVSTSGFRRYLEYFLSGGYVFVTPDDIARGLPAQGKYVLTTFDDGYFNNVLALPLLEEFAVPAVFFIATDHIRTGDAYWWDALYRKRAAQGGLGGLPRELAELKRLEHGGIRAYMIEEFGSDVLTPHGDHDRPMTPEELRGFAATPWVHIGNHTAHHAILTNYHREGVRAEIDGAQDYLEELLGERPTAISYPNGNHSDEVVSAAAECGLTVGITTIPEANELPVADAGRLRLGRYCFDHRTGHPRQLATYRARHSLGRVVRRIRSGGRP